ncbi:MAG: 8-oxoguanine DNA glycosylase [Clostridia bacterium]|nr:8-oxoguanine DNA glycosylase [Clostridia bacterium]
MNCDLCLKVNTFNLQFTLECGQCFRWEKTDENEYIGVIDDRVLKIRQEGENLFIWSNNKENLKEKVEYYFDIKKDYKKLEQEISKIDDNIKQAVKFSSGIRILNQPLFETLISYIISANNNIKRISKSVKSISEKYGKKIEFEGNEYYLFPTLKELSCCTVEELLKCGLGFRAKYVKHDVDALMVAPNILDVLKNCSTEKAMSILLELMGVGPKVADCIMLFSLGKSEVFPVDVWVKRIMEKLYFRKNTTLKEIRKYSQENYGINAGIIQQHLFYNVRVGNL